ncbi:hypothetical protein MTO96_022676 [Rhipicephalus appendiculatus]
MVDLELKELSPGKLSLVESHGAYPSRETWHEWHLAATLLHHLLTLHRCVVSVDLNKLHILRPRGTRLRRAAQESEPQESLPASGAPCPDGYRTERARGAELRRSTASSQPSSRARLRFDVPRPYCHGGSLGAPGKDPVSDDAQHESYAYVARVRL